MMGVLGLREVKPRELSLVLDSGGITRARSRFGGGKISEPYAAAIKFKFGRPPTGLFKKRNTPIAAGVVGADTRIAFVLTTGRKPQILKAVIVGMAVSVVDLTRHLTMNEPPRETMGKIPFVLKSDLSMPRHDIHVTRDITDSDSVRRRFNPPKDASVGVVGQVVAYFGKAHKYNRNGLLRSGQALGAMI